MLVLRARARMCAVCGRLAVEPVKCPRCGATVCRECLAKHMETHYIKIQGLP